MAGLAVTPSPVMWLIMSFFVCYLIKKYAPKRITIPIVTLMGLSYIPLIFITKNVSIIIFYIIAGITGAGLGIVITMNTLLSQRVVPEDSVGVASSMLTLGRTLGQTLMTGIFGLIFNLSINNSVHISNSISFEQINNFISSTNHAYLGNKMDTVMSTIVLKGMHSVFEVVLIIFIIILVINILDKNNEVIK